MHGTNVCLSRESMFPAEYPMGGNNSHAADDVIDSSLRRATLQETAVVERSNTARNDKRFRNNRTVFGAILRGELPAKILYEDECVSNLDPSTS